MPIWLFAISIIFVVVVARVKHIRALSPYGIFIAFQLLYNLMPWITAAFLPDIGLASLLTDKHVIEVQLVLSASANICFGLVHLLYFRNVRFSPPPAPASRGARSHFLYLALPFFLVTCVLCHLYGWHQYTFAGYAADSSSLGGMFTVTAYFKYFFVAIYLYYIYRFGLDRGAWILLGEHVVVMAIDGARTTFLPVLLVTLFVFLDKITNAKRLRQIYVIAVGGIVLSIGTRALILHSGSLLEDMLIPVTTEGTMGDYASLQSIEGAMKLPHPPYTFGASYVVDPLVWLVPQAGGRKGLSSMDHWSEGISNVLQENFAPMGGFYYVSEAVAAFSYAGPAIITTIFAGFLVWIEKNKNRHRLLYLAWMPTIGVLFVKLQFGNAFKLFLINYLAIYFLFCLSKLKRFLPLKDLLIVRQLG